MITYRKSLLRPALRDEQGQVLPWVALMMGLFIGFGAFVLDVSHAYFCYHQLQAATDAAALAGAQSLNAASPNSIVDAFSALAGGNNAYSSLTLNGSNSVSMVPGYPKYTCLGSPITQAACVGPEDANAIQVAEQAIVPTFFARIFGINQMTLSATSTAAIVGARNEPTNIAVVLDTTASMKTVDSNCIVNGASAERIACAEQGVSVLLQDLSPCNTALGCGTPITNGVAPNALDSVAIFTFPNVTTGTTNDDYNCSGANPAIPAYSFPTIGSTTYDPTGSSTATYQITPFLSDYRSSDAASAGLVTGSDLVMTTGSGKKNGSSCPGMAAPGGDGTYYAGVIYAAQSALTAQAASEVAANSTVVPVNIMIVLSDGEANAVSSKMATTTTGGVTVNRSSPWPSGGGATSSVTNYPSALDQCQQAVAAANFAKGQGTQVYTIAYGSESSGCTTDSTGPQVNITPCQVMSQMASPNTTKTTYFYSDYNQSGSSSTCMSPGSPITNINSIFQQISTNLLTVRLLPQSVWPSS
jgi:Putative Flp pilus-assembly TadE/G-like